MLKNEEYEYYRVVPNTSRGVRVIYKFEDARPIFINT